MKSFKEECEKLINEMSPTLKRAEGIVDTKALKEFKKSGNIIINDLIDDGWEVEDTVDVILEMLGIG